MAAPRKLPLASQRLFADAGDDIQLNDQDIKEVEKFLKEIESLNDKDKKEVLYTLSNKYSLMLGKTLSLMEHRGLTGKKAEQVSDLASLLDGMNIAEPASGHPKP